MLALEKMAAGLIFLKRVVRGNVYYALRRNKPLKTIIYGFLLSLVSVYTIYHLYFGPGYMLYVHKDIRSACTIPEVNPFDPEIMKFFWRPDPIVCSKDSELVYFDYDSKLHINRSRTGSMAIVCNYREVKRKDDYNVEFGPETWFNDSVVVRTDHIKVECIHNRKVIYNRLHFQVYKNENFRNRKPTDSPKYNILLFGMDSLSRLAAIRELPKTMSYLENILGAFTLKGYTKVGDNTLPNLVPILTGEYAFSEKFPVRKGLSFDNHPLIWKNISSLGGATLFLEDWPRINTFNLGTSGGGGFMKPPTNHYMRPYYLAISQTEMFESPVSDVLQFFEDKNVKIGSKSYLCYGDKTMHGIAIEYFKRFLVAYKRDLKFTLVWSNKLSHNYVNFIKLADDDLLELMMFMKNEGFLENSFLIFLSDHGSRLDKIRNTPIGRLEERLPLLSIVVPQEIRNKYPHLVKNLRNNINRLTSPFDMHATLVDILNENFDGKKDLPSANGIGVSLFRPVSERRSCEDAGIDEHNCVCYATETVNVSNPVAIRLASYILQLINEEIRGEKCAVLSLDSILSAKRVKSQLGYDTNNQNKKPLLYMFYRPKDDHRERYQLLIKANPSGATFEATIEHRSLADFTLLGDISRTNSYGNQSACITNPERTRLKKFCYCVQ